MATDAPAPTELRDRVRAVEHAYGGTFERVPRPDGRVIARLRRDTGEVIGGVGADTAAAVTDLERRVAAFLAALGDES